MIQETPARGRNPSGGTARTHFLHMKDFLPAVRESTGEKWPSSSAASDLFPSLNQPNYTSAKQPPNNQIPFQGELTNPDLREKRQEYR